jgi:osmotically-inducible protein OsmY
VITNKTDTQLREDVVRELEWDTQIDGTSIGVSTRHGVVTLTGTVRGWADKHAIEDAVHRIAGVLDLANEIEIESCGAGGKTDTEIAEAVRHALEWTRFVPDRSIHSTVWKGSVTLTGTVRTLRERDYAEHLVRNLEGVRFVENRLVVECPHVAPSELQTSIRQALERHVSREAGRIDVEIKGDTVIVSGAVGSWAERRAVLGAAKGTFGVRRVDDHLHIA